MLNHARYCPLCSNELTWKNDEKTTCINCGSSIYENPKPTNAVIITNEFGEILLGRRSIDPFKGMLDIPGGFMTIDETVEESAVREIREELGVSISANALSYFRSYPERYVFEQMNYWLISFVFTTTITKDTLLRPTDDISEALWVNPKTLDINRIAFESMKEAIKDFIAV